MKTSKIIIRKKRKGYAYTQYKCENCKRSLDEPILLKPKYCPECGAMFNGYKEDYYD